MANKTDGTIQIRISSLAEIALKQFPGGDVNWWLQQISEEGIYAMADHFAAGGKMSPPCFDVNPRRIPRRIRREKVRAARAGARQAEAA